MPRETVHQSQGLAGTERYGAVHTGEVRQMMPAHMQPGIEPAPPSGTKYGIVNQCSIIKSDGNPCMAPKKGDTDFCVGHGKQIKNAQLALEKEQASTVQE